jgi:hypothetical protein
MSESNERKGDNNLITNSNFVIKIIKIRRRGEFGKQRYHKFAESYSFTVRVSDLNDDLNSTYLALQ